jgi:hypothetical protein
LVSLPTILLRLTTFMAACSLLCVVARNNFRFS